MPGMCSNVTERSVSNTNHANASAPASAGSPTANHTLPEFRAMEGWRRHVKDPLGNMEADAEAASVGGAWCLECRGMLGPALALGTSLAYGVGDYLGGTTSRRIGTLPFIFCAQLVMLVLAAVWVAVSADPTPPVGTLAAAAGAGLGMTVGLSAFFQAMAVGKMSLVAPISATGVAIPVAAGILRGEHPGAVQVAGMLASVAGVVVVTRSRGEQQPRAESGLGLALLAAIGTGLFMWLMAPASRHGVAWAIMVSRAIPGVLLIAVVIVRRPSLRPALRSGPARRIVAQAVLGLGASVLYAFATLHSQLAIVSVLGSLYPAVTLVLAHRLLSERLDGVQQIGISAVLGGVLLLSA